MASGTLERCSLHGWIPVFTVKGRWQTACMASCGWAVCWCQRCGLSGQWWWWGYGMGRRMLYTMNILYGILNAQKYCDEILRPIVVPFIHNHHLMLQHDNARPHVARICTQLLEAEKNHSSCMASILTRYDTHWACLGCSGSAYTTACSSSCQYPATSHSHWRGVDQHFTGHNQQPDQLYAKEMAKGGHTRYWLVFGPPPIQ